MYNRVLKRLYWFLKDAPARVEDYKALSGTDILPLRFCSTRWLEDVMPAERAIKIWPAIEKFVRKIGEGPKIKIPKTSELQTSGSNSRSTNYSQTTVLYNTGTAVETISDI